MKLDATDLRILAELQADGSLSNVELARRVHLSPSPCLARVKALEAAGVIARYVALANASAQKKKGTSEEVPSFMSEWRARSDSNARPSGS